MSAGRKREWVSIATPWKFSVNVDTAKQLFSCPCTRPFVRDGADDSANTLLKPNVPATGHSRTITQPNGPRLPRCSCWTNNELVLWWLFTINHPDLHLPLTQAGGDIALRWGGGHFRASQRHNGSILGLLSSLRFIRNNNTP